MIIFIILAACTGWHRHRWVTAQVGSAKTRVQTAPSIPFIPSPARPSGDRAAPPAPTPTRLPGTAAPRGSQGTEAPPVLGCAQQVPHCPGHLGRQECHIPAPAGLTTGTALRPHEDVQDQVTKAPVTKRSAATAATGYPQCPAEVLAKIMRRKKKTPANCIYRGFRPAGLEKRLERQSQAVESKDFQALDILLPSGLSQAPTPNPSPCWSTLFLQLQPVAPSLDFLLSLFPCCLPRQLHTPVSDAQSPGATS